MLSETIKLRLAERFAAPLPEFHKRRIVFWHDGDGEFSEGVDELDLPCEAWSGLRPIPTKRTATSLCMNGSAETTPYYLP